MAEVGAFGGIVPYEGMSKQLTGERFSLTATARVFLIGELRNAKCNCGHKAMK